jgi:hypothetical protein
VRKQKPPPGFISGGALDMARGHAGNIQPKALGAPTPPPKVVLSVETDTRRVPTAPRLIAGGKGDSERPPPAVLAAAVAAGAVVAGAPAASPWGAPAAPVAGEPAASPWSAAAVEVVDKRDLPSANLPVAPPPPVVPAKQKSSGWLRYAVVLMLVLLAAGVVRRVRGMGGSAEAPTGVPQRTVAVAPPLDPEATADPAGTAAARPRRLAAQAPSDGDPNAAPGTDPTADPTADPSAEAPPDPTAVVVAPRPRAAPPPPKPTFKPLFELPQEKAKESP